MALPAKKKSDLESIEDNQKLNAKSKEKELQKQRNQAKLKLEQRRKARAAKKNNQNTFDYLESNRTLRKNPFQN